MGCNLQSIFCCIRREGKIVLATGVLSDSTPEPVTVDHYERSAEAV